MLYPFDILLSVFGRSCTASTPCQGATGWSWWGGLLSEAGEESVSAFLFLDVGQVETGAIAQPINVSVGDVDIQAVRCDSLAFDVLASGHGLHCDVLCEWRGWFPFPHHIYTTSSYERQASDSISLDISPLVKWRVGLDSSQAGGGDEQRSHARKIKSEPVDDGRHGIGALHREQQERLRVDAQWDRRHPLRPNDIAA